MDPQSKSLLTTIGGYAAAALVSWAITRGVITPDQQVGVTTAITTLGGTLAAAGLAEYKRRQVSQTAMIKSINSTDNGVKVVPDDARSAPIQAVNAPIK